MSVHRINSTVCNGCYQCYAPGATVSIGWSGQVDFAHHDAITVHVSDLHFHLRDQTKLCITGKDNHHKMSGFNTMQCNAAQPSHSTAQPLHSTAQPLHSTAHYSTAQHSTAQHSTANCCYLSLQQSVARVALACLQPLDQRVLSE